MQARSISVLGFRCWGDPHGESDTPIFTIAKTIRHVNAWVHPDTTRDCCQCSKSHRAFLRIEYFVATPELRSLQPQSYERRNRGTGDREPTLALRVCRLSVYRKPSTVLQVQFGMRSLLRHPRHCAHRKSPCVHTRHTINRMVTKQAHNLVEC